MAGRLAAGLEQVGAGPHPVIFDRPTRRQRYHGVDPSRLQPAQPGGEVRSLLAARPWRMVPRPTRPDRRPRGRRPGSLPTDDRRNRPARRPGRRDDRARRPPLPNHRAGAVRQQVPEPLAPSAQGWALTGGVPRSRRGRDTVFSDLTTSLGSVPIRTVLRPHGGMRYRGQHRPGRDPRRSPGPLGQGGGGDRRRQRQTGVIGSTLPEPLSVELRNEVGAPVAGKPVIFKVRGNDGLLGGAPPSGRSSQGATGAPT